MDDRRRAARIGLDLNVKAQFASVDDAADARTLDVSRTGLFLVGVVRPIGTHVTCEFTIEAPPLRLKLGGVVMRLVHPGEAHFGRGGVGILLEQVPEAWNDFVTELERRSVTVVDEDA